MKVTKEYLAKELRDLVSIFKLLATGKGTLSDYLLILTNLAAGALLGQMF